MFSKILSTIADAATSIAEDIGKAAQRYTSSASVSRMSAAIALMAYLPDGNADDTEIAAGINAITAKTGGVFGFADMLKLVRADVAKLQASRTLGKAELFARLQEAGPQEREWLVAVCVAIGEASDATSVMGRQGAKEDPFTPAERALAKEIAAALGVDGSRFGI